MADRTVNQHVLVEPQPGSGIIHPFPTPELPHLDPFVFLDTGAPRDLGDHAIHVAPHPHRGVQPVSLVFRAEIEHRDSLGTHRTVRSGGMQWLVAGSGALHEEVLRGDDDGIFHMAQLWVNVPAGAKLDPPEHHAIEAEQVPVFSIDGGARLRLFAGEAFGHRGPAPLGTPVLIVQVMLDAGTSARVPVPRGWNAAATVVDGTADVDGAAGLAPGSTVVFADDGDDVAVSSSAGGQVLLMAGEPIGEPIVMGGGFVMNDRSEIEQAFADHEAGRMGTLSSTR